MPAIWHLAFIPMAKNHSMHERQLFRPALLLRSSNAPAKPSYPIEDHVSGEFDDSFCESFRRDWPILILFVGMCDVIRLFSPVMRISELFRGLLLWQFAVCSKALNATGTQFAFELATGSASTIRGNFVVSAFHSHSVMNFPVL